MLWRVAALITSVREGFPYHSQWSSNFTAIFNGNYKFLPSIDLEKFYGQLVKIEMEGVSGNPRNPPKTAPEWYCTIM